MKMNTGIFFGTWVLIILLISCGKKEDAIKPESYTSAKKSEVTVVELIEEETWEFNWNNPEISLNELFKKYNLMAYFPCNFSEEYDEEFIVFYNDPSQIYDSSSPLSIDKVIVLFFKEKELDILNDLKLVSLGYEGRNLEIILEDSKKYGEWNDFCYLTDTDGNGLDEFYFYAVSGMSFGLIIIEYLNDEFEEVEYVEY